MPAAVIRLQSKLIQMRESRVLKVIGIILISIVIIILGLFKFWKETHKDLQTNTGEILKILVCMDLGFSEEDSEKIILNLTEEDNLKIDNILNKYTNGLQIIDRLSELTDFNNIRDILSNEDIDNIQTIYKKYIDKENKYGE